MDGFIGAERIEDSHGIEAVRENKKTLWRRRKRCHVMNCRHYSDQFKEENVDFDVRRALA
jgi:hypothetical protein